MVNWWSVIGLACDIVGAAGAGLDAFIWRRSAPFDLFPNTPATARGGVEVPRRLYRARHWIYWTLIVVGFALQLVGQFR
jgi:hypothetical protein